MTLFRFMDNLTHEDIAMFRATEEDAWNDLCDWLGTGYVFENVERI